MSFGAESRCPSRSMTSAGTRCWSSSRSGSDGSEAAGAVTDQIILESTGLPLESTYQIGPRPVASPRPRRLEGATAQRNATAARRTRPPAIGSRRQGEHAIAGFEAATFAL